MTMTTISPMTMPTTAARFAEDRYVVLPGLIDGAEAAMLYAYSREVVARGQFALDDQVPGTPVRYGPSRMEILLQDLLPRIEEASGLSLYPTYSYLRIYKHGDALARHRDRPACEVSVSLCLGHVAEAQWPLWIEGPNGIAAVAMQPGDALLYRGVECLHWREPFSGEQAAQVFLHYVERSGPHAEWKFDKRRGLGMRPA